VARYLTTLQQQLAPSPLAVMQSSGGTMAADQAAQRAVNMLLSGPAGGLAAARFIGQQCGQQRLLTFDMGGTSTDVALLDGAIGLTSEGRIGHYPVAVPMVDMHTIGAGGGSIASVDAGGLLQVGPASAGADPGPACYGRGGVQATVSDANAVLGRLRPEAFLGGAMALDIDAARAAVARLASTLGLSVEAAALGIVQLANEHMTRALRVISVQRGHNPAAFTLCCFGGAGGLHVCALAENLAVRTILVPYNPGVLSALGMLVAPRERQLSLTHQCLLEHLSDAGIDTIIDQLYRDGCQQLAAEGVARDCLQRHPSLDLRYQGQSYTLNVPWQDITRAVADFHRAHHQRYGHDMPLAVELVNVRLALRASQPALQLPELASPAAPARPQHELLLAGFKQQPVSVYERSQLLAQQVLQGPALVTERTATTLVGDNWQATVDKFGNLQLEHLV
jgi:N-methylhydantoinase A